MTVDEKTAPGKGKDKKQFATARASSKSLVGKRPATLLPSAITFFIMMGFWLVFSGKFDVFHLTMGIVSSLLITLFSADLFFPKGLQIGFLSSWVKFALYTPWLLYQILLANLHVLRLCFHPKMMDLIDPHIIEFNTRLKSDIARTTFANSITLTPGTISVNVSLLGRVTVHCIDTLSGEALPGEMERRVADVFNE